MSLRLTGKYCSSCNSPQKGAWSFTSHIFVTVPVEHEAHCRDLSAPLLDYAAWDEVIIAGGSPNIPCGFCSAMIYG